MGCIDPTLPPGAQISCDSNAGCPPQMQCANALNRCVGASNDVEAPTLENDATPSPTLGKEGTTFTVELVASEKLGAPPVVVATVGDNASGARLPPFELDSPEDGERGDRRTYRLHYKASGFEPNGVASLTATLIDEVGNARDVAAGAFELDLSPPILVASRVLEGEFATVGTTIDIEVLFTEEPGPETLIFMRDFTQSSVFFFTPTTTDRTRWEYVVTGEEGDGAHPIFAVPFDAAGNRGGNQAEEGQEIGFGTMELGAVELDFTAPLVVGAGVDGSVQGPNDLMTLGIHFDERLRSERILDDDITTEAIPFATAVLRGGDPVNDAIVLEVRHAIERDFDTGGEYTVLTIEHRVRECDTEGTFDVVLDGVVDVAGNEISGVTDEAWAFRVDGVVVCE